jgi:hypothetical protein
MESTVSEYTDGSRASSSEVREALELFQDELNGDVSTSAPVALKESTTQQQLGPSPLDPVLEVPDNTTNGYSVFSYPSPFAHPGHGPGFRAQSVDSLQSDDESNFSIIEDLSWTRPAARNNMNNNGAATGSSLFSDSFLSGSSSTNPSSLSFASPNDNDTNAWAQALSLSWSPLLAPETDSPLHLGPSMLQGLGPSMSDLNNNHHRSINLTTQELSEDTTNNNNSQSGLHPSYFSSVGFLGPFGDAEPASEDDKSSRHNFNSR